MFAAIIAVVLHLSIQLAFVVRVLLRPHREPASRIAWVVVIAAVPIFGMVAYLFLGEVSIGRRRIKRKRDVLETLIPIIDEVTNEVGGNNSEVPEQYQHLFGVGKSISWFPPVGGNSATLMADSNATIDSMVADIDAAEKHVHLLFYIWLADNNGCKVVEAVKRAASGGVRCRVMADNLGSRLMIKSNHWQDMKDAGVQTAVALPIENPLVRPFTGRVDLRNHRKIVVIDGRITYCGSQNCADAEFRVKPKYAPWVDTVMRFEGPIAQQNQFVFAADWMAGVGEDLTPLLREAYPAAQSGFTAQVIGSGPTSRNSAMPEMFETLMHAARRELVITTPYYVPDESMQAALSAAAHRGVEATIVFPARNDSWIVAAASRSYYEELLKAGVKIHEYVGGLLHAKTLTLDGDVSLIGSANMDRRSFDLNYENNILFYDPDLTKILRQRQQAYIDKSNHVSIDEVANWSTTRRLWNNSIAMLGPVL